MAKLLSPFSFILRTFLSGLFFVSFSEVFLYFSWLIESQTKHCCTLISELNLCWFLSSHSTHPSVHSGLNLTLWSLELFCFSFLLKELCSLSLVCAHCDATMVPTYWLQNELYKIKQLNYVNWRLQKSDKMAMNFLSPDHNGHGESDESGGHSYSRC